MSKPTDKKPKQKAPDLVVSKDEKDSNGGNEAANDSAREGIAKPPTKEVVTKAPLRIEAAKKTTGSETPEAPVRAEAAKKPAGSEIAKYVVQEEVAKVPPRIEAAKTPAKEEAARTALREEDAKSPSREDVGSFDGSETFVGDETAVLSEGNDKNGTSNAVSLQSKGDASALAPPNPMATTADPVPLSSLPSPQAAAAALREPIPSVKDQLVGQVLDGKYEITRVVGHGGMSVVYEAKHLLMNKVVALKLMHKHLHHSDKAVRRFQKEAQAVATLNHDGVIRIYDFGVTTDGSPFIAMEFLSGKSLSDYIKVHGRLDEESATAAFKNIADSLAHAHEKGIVHRDLKPSNIVLTEPAVPTGPIKTTVVDFGIAKMTGEDTGEHMKLTTTGEVFGSPLYMSPEQCAGRELDQRSDIYSFGCLMYEAVTGRTPFEAKSAMALFHSHQKNEAPKFSTIEDRPNISEELEGIILKCLEKHPLDRFQTMQDLVKALNDLGADGAVPVLTRMRRKESLVFMLTALLIVGIASPILASMWHLFLGQVVFFLLVFVVTASASYSMYYKFFEMKRTMEVRSHQLNMAQKAKLSFTLLSAVLMSIWSVGMMFYIAAKGTQNPFIDALAQWLWIGSVFLVALYAVGMIIFAGYTALMALSKEST